MHIHSDTHRHTHTYTQTHTLVSFAGARPVEPTVQVPEAVAVKSAGPGD